MLDTCQAAHNILGAHTLVAAATINAAAAAPTKTLLTSASAALMVAAVRSVWAANSEDATERLRMSWAARDRQCACATGFEVMLISD